jgi:hypothetical protein
MSECNGMDHPVDDTLRQICREIIEEQRSQAGWAEVESDDMFQSGNYVGGFDADEQAFCFSVYRPDGEYWFQISLQQVYDIVDGKLQNLKLRSAEL